MLISKFISLISCLMGMAAAASSATQSVTVSKVDLRSASVQFKIGVPAQGESHVAYATYSDSTEHVSNFGQLFVRTSGDFEDDLQGFAAGFAEGYLSAQRISQQAYNMACQVDCSGKAPEDVAMFFKQQDVWIRKMVQENGDSDDMWKFVGFLMNQLDGVMAGYHSSDFGKENPMDPWLFTMLNALGDLLDILPALDRDARPDFKQMSHGKMREYMNKNGHCSALIRLTDDMTDIYAAHSTWFIFSSMLRIYKTYNFNLRNKSNRAPTMSFSSYPGVLASQDDFYMMGESQLIMVQTTNNIFNATLWDLVQPESLLSWHRIRSANQLADNGPEWFSIAARYNSGTYNNQYMVLDGKLFQSGNALQENTLFVVEQIPGLVVGKDVTAELERGYWPSFNVPYHEEIYVASGYPEVDAKAGALPFTEYQMAPRAQIFRRDQAGVTDTDSMCELMRSNKYDTDPLFAGQSPDPWNAICARGDLSQPVPSAGGGYDTKVTSILNVRSSEGAMLRARIVNGPTSQGQPAFAWSKSGALEQTDRHTGQPDVFDFEFEDVQLSLDQL